MRAAASQTQCGPLGAEKPNQRDRQGRGKKRHHGKLGEHGQSGRRAKERAAERARLFQPCQGGNERGSQEGGERHIRGGQPRVRQHGRQKAEQEHGHYRAQRAPRRAEIAFAPPVHHQAGDPEEREDSETRQRQRQVVMAIAVEDLRAFLGHFQSIWLGGPLRSNTQQIGAQRRCHPRQRGMLRFIGVGPPVEPFHAAGDVVGLIGGVVENRVGGDDSDGSNQNQEQNGGPRMALEESDCGGERWSGNRGGFDGCAAFLPTGGHMLRI